MHWYHCDTVCDTNFRKKSVYHMYKIVSCVLTGTHTHHMCQVEKLL